MKQNADEWLPVNFIYEFFKYEHLTKLNTSKKQYSNSFEIEEITIVNIKVTYHTVVHSLNTHNLLNKFEMNFETWKNKLF